jgi:cyclic pyranopterin phosphate synthase
VRVEIWKLIERLGRIDGIQEVALTTNGMLLVDQAEKLKTAGLDRLNISLDTLREETFEKISRRQGLAAVLAGIAAAQSAGFEKIRLNALSIRGLTEEDIVPLARFARQRKLPLRFIEFMPLDADRNWQSEQVLSGAEVRKLLERTFGPLLPSERTNSSQPAVDYQFADQCGQIGFINPVTAPFCSNCNRLRITAEGKIRNCLFSTAEWDVRQLLRDATIERSAADKMIAEQLLSSVAAKKAGHGINSAQFVRPERAMYQIGG